MYINIYTAYKFKDMENIFARLIEPRKDNVTEQSIDFLNTLYDEYESPRTSIAERYIAGTYNNIRSANSKEIVLYPEIGLNDRMFVKFAEEIIKKYKDTDKVINLYTEHTLIIDSFRLMIKKKIIETYDIQFKFIDTYSAINLIECNEDGKII